MRHLNVIVIMVLMLASLAATGMFGDRTQNEINRLKILYRQDKALLQRELYNCSRWRQQSTSMGGMCDGAFRGYATMSNGPSCVAAEAVSKELGVALADLVFLIPTRQDSVTGAPQTAATTGGKL